MHPAIQGLNNFSRDMLLNHYDQRIQDQRQQEDETPLESGINPAQNNYFKTFNRGQQDAAMGPAGYNREWAGFLEAPIVQAENDRAHKYKMNYGSLDLPTSSYSGPAGGTLERDAPNPAIEALNRATPQVHMNPINSGHFGQGVNGYGPPMPDSHENFMAGLANRYGPLTGR